MDALHARGRLVTLAATLTLSVLLAACSAGAASAPPSAAPSAPPTQAPAPTDPPPSDGGDGGNVAPDGAKVVIPRPGQLDVHPIAAETLSATVEGRRLTVAATWWSGVEPCTILDTVIVDAEDGGFAITLREGRGPEDVACIAIAEQHRTFIEFPNDLDPGTYTIRDSTGGAPPIEVVIP
jgi:hypothetical protein